MYRFLLLAGLWFITSPAYASELTEIQAASIDVSGFRGVVYYTSESDGYRVVTTISEGENGLPLRFEASLLDGQKVIISVPGKLGEAAHALEVRRVHSTVTVAPPPPPEAILASP